MVFGEMLNRVPIGRSALQSCSQSNLFQVPVGDMFPAGFFLSGPDDLFRAVKRPDRLPRYFVVNDERCM